MSLTTELETPTRDEELARLARALWLARGFRLYFARSLPGGPRRELLDDLSAELGREVRVFDAEPDLDHLRSALESELANGEPPGAVCVTGIETWVPAGADGAGSAFVRNLNAARDRFAQTVPCPVVIWGADHVLRAIQHGAPDFFSVASGIYLFPQESQERADGREESRTLEGVARWLRELAEIDDRLQAMGIEGVGTQAIDRIGLLNRRVELLLELARYEEAEREAKRACEEAHRVLGDDRPDTLASANNLARLYEATGRFAEAEPLYAATLAANRRVLGDDHPDTLWSANNLATLYESTGRYAEAEPLFAATLAARRRVLGDDHPDTLRSANNLAALYRSTGRYAEAEPLFAATLAANRRVLGDDHPDTLRSANNLAALYQATGRFAEAEPLYAATLAARCRVLGDDHPDTLRCANNLAFLYWSTGRSAKAFALIQPLLPAARRLPSGHEVRKAIEGNFGVLRDGLWPRFSRQKGLGKRGKK